MTGPVIGGKTIKNFLTCTPNMHTRIGLDIPTKPVSHGPAPLRIMQDQGPPSLLCCCCVVLSFLAAARAVGGRSQVLP